MPKKVFAPGNRWLVAYLAFLSAFAPLSTDMYLPALPHMTQALQTTDALSSLSISCFLLLFGASMLFWGPLSDKYGRKPVLYTGALLYVVSSLFLALAQSIWPLLFWRAVQAIGSGGITYLGNNLYVNTFSVNDYNDAIEHDRMSLMGKATFSKHDQMRYRFMMQLFGLRLDKRQFKKDFGVSVERGLPVEMAFMKASGAFDRDNADELTLTPKGRYLMVVMMRQFFIGVNNLRDQARAALVGEERELIFGDGK